MEPMNFKEMIAFGPPGWISEKGALHYSSSRTQPISMANPLGGGGGVARPGRTGHASSSADGDAIAIDNTFHAANKRLNLARATRSHMHAFGIGRHQRHA